jgi:hypothetical protein
MLAVPRLLSAGLVRWCAEMIFITLLPLRRYRPSSVREWCTPRFGVHRQPPFKLTEAATESPLRTNANPNLSTSVGDQVAAITVDRRRDDRAAAFGARVLGIVPELRRTSDVRKEEGHGFRGRPNFIAERRPA